MVKLFLIDLSILQFSKVYLQITVIIGVDPYSAIDIRSQKVTAHRCIFASRSKATLYSMDMSEFLGTSSHKL